MIDLSKICIRVSPLSNQIVIARFGKDPELALDTRNAENEFFHALCSYVLGHKVPEPGKGGVVQFGGGNEQFTAIVRRFLTEEDASADTALRNAAPDMLKALKRIVHDWDGEPEDMAEAREAIAKAEARS